MTSPHKSAANRLNGRKSRGPRSAAGKSRSRVNALRHGLSTIHRNNPLFMEEITRLVEALCGNSDDPLLLEEATVIAEANVLLQSARAEQIAVIERLLNARALPFRAGLAGLAEAKARAEECMKAFDLVEAVAGQSGKAGQDDPTAPLRRLWTPRRRSIVEALRLAVPQLRRLKRYERRAWSRRRRAMGAFMALQALRALPSTDPVSSRSPQS